MKEVIENIIEKLGDNNYNIDIIPDKDIEDLFGITL